MSIQPITYKNECAHIITIPEHGDESDAHTLKQIWIEESPGDYNLVTLLRKYHKNPQAIYYLADMAE
mgnify:CR=1 FL=1